MESSAELTTFDKSRKFDPTRRCLAEQSRKIIASYLEELRNAPRTNVPVLSLTSARRAEYVAKELQPADEALVFTPPGFKRRGRPQSRIRAGRWAGWISLFAIGATGNKTPCRVNVVGPDGNYYEPEHNPLKEHSYTAEWPHAGWGNRALRAPVRYLGRPFYTTGECTVAVPAGKVRVEVWKGFEYRPETLTVVVVAGAKLGRWRLHLTKTSSGDDYGYWSGDPHIHFHAAE